MITTPVSDLYTTKFHMRLFCKTCQALYPRSISQGLSCKDQTWETLTDGQQSRWSEQAFQSQTRPSTGPSLEGTVLGVEPCSLKCFFPSHIYLRFCSKSPFSFCLQAGGGQQWSSEGSGMRDELGRGRGRALQWPVCGFWDWQRIQGCPE